MTKNPEEVTVRGNPNLVIAAVPQTMVEMVWPKVEVDIQRVVDVSHNEVSVESIKNRLLSGQSMMVCIGDKGDIIAVNVLEVREMETGLRCLYIPIIGGNRMEEWIDRFVEVITAIAKDLRCTELRGIAVRKGWLRRMKEYNFKEVHTVMSCQIGEE